MKMRLDAAILRCNLRTKVSMLGRRVPKDEAKLGS